MRKEVLNPGLERNFNAGDYSPVKPRNVSVMKKSYFFVAALLMLTVICGRSLAQTAASYAFSATMGGYTPIAGTGWGITASSDDGNANNIPLNFNFHFCGATYTAVNLNANGNMSFNPTASAVQWNNSALSNLTTPGVMVFWDDLYFRTEYTPPTTITYTTTGSAGSRVFTAQWDNSYDQAGTGGYASFQVKLYEGTDVIQLVYGPSTNTSTNVATPGTWAPSATLGIANSSSDFLNVSNTTDFTTPAASSTAYNSSVGFVPVNSVFSFTPQPYATTSLTSLTFANTAVGSSSAGQTFSLTAGTLSPAAGNLTVTAPTGFQVSSDGVTWVSSYTIPYTGGSLAATTVNVRFSPLVTLAYTGNVTVTGGGLPAPKNIAVTGSGSGACNAAPTPGTVTASASAGCSSYTSNLSLSGSSTASGLGYQWQSSSDNLSWLPVTGATNATYTTAAVTTNIYYRAVITCLATSNVAQTPGQLLSFSSAAYATVPFTEGFEGTWNSVCGNKDVPTNFWRNTPVTGNNSWRREDETTTVSGWLSTSGAYTPTGSVGTHSARFHSFNTSSGVTGSLDLYVNLSSPSTKQITYDYINTTGADALVCQVSTDGGATFTIIDVPPAVAAVWTTRTVATAAFSATAIIRFIATSDGGSTDIGLDNVNVTLLPDCVAPTAQATALVLTPALTSIGGSFTFASPAANGYLVLMTTTSTAPSAPVDGTTYVPGTTALGGTVVASSALNTFTATGLTPGTQYWFWVYAYNNTSCGYGPKYRTATPLTGNGTALACSMAGTKVIGPNAGADYASIGQALSAAYTSGIGAGGLALELQTAYTGATETVPIVINQVACASASRTITIRPQGAVTMTYSAAGSPFFDLNGANWVVIDGRVGSIGTTKSLTIVNGHTGGQNVRFINDASNNVVKYCIIKSQNISTTQGAIFFSTTTAVTGNDNNLIDNCDITDNASSPAFYLSAIYASGTTGKDNDHNTISNCNISNFWSPTASTNAININGGNTDWTITNNRLFQTATRNYTTGNLHRGIFITNTTNGNNFIITNNVIGYATATATGTYSLTGTVGTQFFGIEFNGAVATPTSIQGNTFANINVATSSSASATGGAVCGIKISAGSANVGTISPNIIGSNTGNDNVVMTTSATGGTICGISTASGTTNLSTPAIVNIQNNMIGGLTANGSTATVGANIQAIQASSNANVTITGNIIGSTTTANSINSPTVSTGTQTVYGINSTISTTVAVNPVISNNTIANLNGAGTATTSFINGILQNGSAAVTISGNIVRNISGATASTNQAGQAGVSGIAITSTSGTPVVTLNTVNAIAATNAGTVATTASGIGFNGNANPSVTRNVIYDIRNASTMATLTTPPIAGGIVFGTPTGTALIANNMISLGTGQTTNTAFSGILNPNTASGTTQIYYNSVDIEGTSATNTMPTACFNRGGYNTTAITSPVDIKNNIFVNNRNAGTGNHYAIGNGIGVATSSATNWGSNISNYNILNATNAATVGYWTGSTTFAAWKTASASDANSFTASTVTFLAPATGDLHINMGATANNVESHGLSLAAVTTDFDNQARPSTSITNGGGLSTDIGADEFDGTPNSNIPPAISYTALSAACGTGDRTLTATIADADGVPITGVLQPRIYFKKGAAGTWFSTQGVKTGGTATNGTWSFTITNSLMGGVVPTDQVFYYVIAQDALGNYGSNTGNGLVAGPGPTDYVNNVTTHPTNANSYTVQLLIIGTIPVGASQTAPFNTLTNAVTAYNSGCISGAVTYSLTDATYASPNETFPIVFQANATASAANTLTVRPAANVNAAINGTTSAASVLKFLDAKFITLDGVNTGGSSLTVSSNNTGTTVCTIWLASSGIGNNNIALKNMTIYGGSAATGSPSEWAILAGNNTVGGNSGVDNDNITISGNTVLRAGYALWASGNTLISAGGNDNWIIDNNFFGPATAGDAANTLQVNGMFIRNMVNLQVTNNTIRNIIATPFGTAGIYMEAGILGGKIIGNTFTNLTSGLSGGTSMGLYLGNPNVMNCNVSRNVFKGLSSTNTGSSFRAIDVNTGTNLSNDSIFNNMISDVYGQSSTTTTSWPIGILVEGSSGGVMIYDNTVNLFGPHPGVTGVTGSACIYINTSGINNDIRDNILSNTYDNTSTTTDKNYAIYSTASNAAFSNIDYNDYYAPSPNVLGFINSADVTTIPAMQAAFNYNTHSISTQPVFTSNTDLHLQIADANGFLVAGTPIAGVPKDFDGTTRSLSTTVLGVHEVNLPICSSVTAGGVMNQTGNICVSGTTVLNLPTATAGLGISYKWQSSPDSITWTTLVGSTNMNYTTPTLTTPVFYRAIVTCVFSGLKDSVGKKVIINATPAAITGSTTVCSGGTTTLTETTSGGVWSSSNTAVATIGSGSGVVTGVTAGTTTISFVTAAGCGTSTLITANTTPPAFTITPATTTMCSGTTQLLQSLSIVSTNATFGTQQNVNADIGASAPFTGYYGGQRVQFLVLASELTAMGFSPGSSLNAINHVVISKNPSYVNNLNFQIRIAPTAVSALNAFVTTGLVTVLSPTTVVAAVGNNILTFTAPYTWDGTSNLVFDETFSNAITGNTPYSVFQYNTNTTFNSHVTYRSDGQSAATMASGTTVSVGPNTARPDFVLYGTKNNPGNAPVWTPTTNLYTDAALTTPYSGVAVYSVYASPSAPTSQVVNTYVATTTSNGCSASASTTLTVNPLPAVITGPSTVCTGATITLASTTTGGTWSSASTNVSVVAASGYVTGNTVGTATITYTAATTGCVRTTIVTINPTPAAITGTASVCNGFTTTLADATASGVWSSSAAGTASVNGIGVVTGNAVGNATISYTTLNGCSATQLVAVNAQPAAITGTPSVCTGLVTTLASTTGGGAWSSLSPNVVATTGNVQGVTPGTALVSYTVGSCSATVVVTVNQSPSAIGGTAAVCEGLSTTLNNSFSGGTWTSSNTNATIGAASGILNGATAGNATITYTLPGACIATIIATINPTPAAIAGTAVVCVNATTTLSNTISGGAWTSGTTSVATATTATATTGAINGIAAGNATITYTLPAGCTVTRVVTVNALPAQFAVTGGGGNCAGSPTVHVGLSASASSTFTYSLKRGSTLVSTLSGANTALDFGVIATDGTYTVLATNTNTSCTNAMTGSATVFTNPLPFAYNVTGGGPACAGGAGVTIGVDVSDPGINYTLKLGSAVIETVGGDGDDISFANVTTSGTYSVVATDGVTGCHADQVGTAVVTINATPIAYNVTGGGNVCGGSGIAVGLDNSETGVNYTLYMGSTVMAGPIAGTSGMPISFGSQTANGTYTVVATSSAGTGCSKNMNGSATVTFYPTPIVQTVSGGGTYCEGAGGVHVTIANSETGVSYQLFNGAIATNAPQAGNTGDPLDFVVTATGTYTVLATNTSTTCHSDMTGSASVTMNPLAIVQTVSGGGNYCAGGAGVAIGLDNSETGVTYTLYNGSASVTSVTGTTGSPVSFGNQTAAGTYTVMATSGTCTNAMTGIVNVIVNTVPENYYVTGGGSLCTGGNGALVGLSGSNNGINYTLYNGSTAVTTAAGDGLVVNFGPQSVAGSYSVRATNATTGCAADMTGAVNVIVNTPPAAHIVSGTGSYCEGAAGLHVMLDVADNGVAYQLYNGTATVGAPITGTGTSLDFGPLAAGTYTIQATDVITHCKTDMTGTGVITMNAAPVVYTVTGGGAYCAGGTGVHIGIPSQAGVDYTLYLGSSAVATASGTGTAPVDFGPVTAAGVYTVHAVNATTACGADMAGTATITVNVQPIVYPVMGSGAYCAGGNGREVTMPGSDFGITYQLYYNGSALGAPVTSVGGPLSFGLQTGVGTYSVQANPGTTCTTDMTGSAVITTNPLPVVGSLTGGGAYCAGGTGVHIGLPTSATGVNYRLYNGATAIGAGPVAGTAGGAIDFGLVTGAGTYSVQATIAATGCVNTTSGTATVSITSLVTPAVAVTSLSGGTICAGQAATFSAAGTNGGSTPAYQWRVNGVNTGIDSTGYTYIPANGDVITVKLTSNAACATPDSAIAGIVMSVVNNVTPTAAITNDRGTEVCLNTLVTFSAATTFAGTSPAYRWVKNGVTVSSALTYAYTPHDNDIVYFVLNSSLGCVTAPEVFSNNILMTVDSPYVPAVTIVAFPGTTIKDGQSDTLVAFVAHGGATPTYQWRVNSTSIAGATNATFISSTLHNNDSVTCVVTGSGVCGLSSFNSVIIKVTSNVGVTEVNTGIADIRLTPNPNKGDFIIKGSLGTLTNDDVNIELTDMLGQVVYKNTVQAKNGNVNEHVVLNSTLANGMYMLSIRSGSEHKVFHMVLEQ